MRLARTVILSLATMLPFTSSFSQSDTPDPVRENATVVRVNVLKIARILAESAYAGFRYGSNPARRQVDCSQFMQAIVERMIGRTLSETEAKAVLIAGLPPGARVLDSLIEANDDRITGVQYALTEIIPIGRAVSVDSVMPGDLIQYWIRSSSGHYKGHTAVIETVGQKGNIPVATLYGSHKTLGRIGTAVDRSGNTLKLKLSGQDRKVFLVRIDPELLTIFFAKQSTFRSPDTEK